jgi:hypothetical protein
MNASDEADEKRSREWAAHTHFFERTKPERCAGDIATRGSVQAIL